MLLGIDPGSSESAYCVINSKMKPIEFAKIDNEQLKDNLPNIIKNHNVDAVAIEHIASYGMAVGKEVFDTCIWVGRFWEIASHRVPSKYLLPIYRKEEKIALCGSMRAKDSNIRQALIDLFAKHDLKNGKGTKANPDWFFGFKSDIWASYAVAYTAKMKLEGKQ